MKTLIVGLLLAFLLFTPQGHFAAEMALEAAVGALAGPTPPDPARVAAHEAWVKKQAEPKPAKCFYPGTTYELPCPVTLAAAHMTPPIINLPAQK